MPEPAAPPLTPPRITGLLSHEAALSCLGAASALALLIRTGGCGWVVFEVAGCTFGLAGVAILLDVSKPNLLKCRLALSAGYVLWFYFAVARIAPLLAMPLQDDSLYAFDVRVLGSTPARVCSSFATPRLTDLLSLCYLSFHAYLIAAFAHALWQPWWYTLRCLRPILMGYAVGMAFYLAMPAVGPALAFPELFAEPLSSGLPFEFNQAVVGWGSSVYDVFPSLHVLIVALLLRHDWHFCRRRFWIMAAPACGLVLSTVYLRYHYGVDLAAGFALFLLIALAPKFWRWRSPGLLASRSSAKLDHWVRLHEPHLKQ